MTHNDFEKEPIPGLPAHLPEGEHIVWQGSPDRKTVARCLLHQRKIMIYFAILAVWYVVTGIYDGEPLAQSVMTVASLGLGAAIVYAIIHWYAGAIARTTIYTITTARVVMRFGVALPVTFNFPFSQITAANMKPVLGDSGTIALQLKEHTKISWPILWPHARPWKLAHPEPAMRMIADVEIAAGLLSTNLHAHHKQRPQQAAASVKQRDESKVSATPVGELKGQGA